MPSFTLSTSSAGHSTSRRPPFGRPRMVSAATSLGVTRLGPIAGLRRGEAAAAWVKVGTIARFAFGWLQNADTCRQVSCGQGVRQHGHCPRCALVVPSMWSVYPQAISQQLRLQLLSVVVGDCRECGITRQSRLNPLLGALQKTPSPNELPAKCPCTNTRRQWVGTQLTQARIVPRENTWRSACRLSSCPPSKVSNSRVARFSLARLWKDRNAGPPSTGRVEPHSS